MWATGRAGETGSTLIEMLVVVAILGLIVGLSFPRVTASMRRANLTRDRSTMVADLKQARADAARTGRSVTLEIAPDAHGYERGGLTVRSFEHERLEGDPAALTFFADGTSSGGQWRIAGPAGALAVVVQPGVGLVEAGP